MTNQYKLFGFELSPYSVKVRSYLRYKNIPHQWIVRSMAQMPEFQKYAKLPLVPLLVWPNEAALQDSTPIIEKLEDQHPEQPINPEDSLLTFVSYLIEEFADEWGNKPMFHYRWRREVDQESAALRLAKEQLGENADDATLQSAKEMIKGRMVSRVWFVGSSDETAPFIESNYKELLELLEPQPLIAKLFFMVIVLYLPTVSCLTPLLYSLIPIFHQVCEPCQVVYWPQGAFHASEWDTTPVFCS